MFSFLPFFKRGCEFNLRYKLWMWPCGRGSVILGTQKKEKGLRQVGKAQLEFTSLQQCGTRPVAENSYGSWVNEQQSRSFQVQKSLRQPGFEKRGTKEKGHAWRWISCFPSLTVPWGHLPTLCSGLQGKQLCGSENEVLGEAESGSQKSADLRGHNILGKRITGTWEWQQLGSVLVGFAQPSLFWH